LLTNFVSSTANSIGKAYLRIGVPKRTTQRNSDAGQYAAGWHH